MSYRISYAIRWVGTALSFTLFGLGGILIPLIGMPVIHLLPGDELCRENRAKKLIQVSFRAFIGFMKFFKVLTYQIDGVEKLKDARLVLANHPTLIDIIFLISLIPNANCVVKGKLVSNPFTRGPIKTAGYIINDEAEDIIAAASEVFAKGQALIVFPEGTRTTPSQPLKFKRGAANIAIRTGTEITPVMIDCTPLSLTKNSPWYRIPPKSMHFQVEVMENFEIKQYVENTPPSLGARMLTRDLCGYFTKELEIYG